MVGLSQIVEWVNSTRVVYHLRYSYIALIIVIRPHKCGSTPQAAGIKPNFD